MRPVLTQEVRRASVALALMLAFGLSATVSAPDGGSAIGIWPVGLAACALVLARGRETLRLLLAVLAIAFVTIVLTRPPLVALGYGLGITAQAWVVARLYGQPARERTRLLTDRDLARLLVAGAVGAALGALIGTVTSVLTGFGEPVQVAEALFFAQLTSLLVLLPLVCELPRRPEAGSRRERVAIWTTLVVATPGLLVVPQVPLVVLLIVPVLAWGALRLPTIEALSQLLAVLAVFTTLTTLDVGPIADVPERYDLFVDSRGIVLSIFCLVCTMIVLPLSLQVGQHVAAVGQVASERDIVRRIVEATRGVAIIGGDEKGRVTLFNPGAERLLGFTAAEVLGTSTRRFLTDDAVRAGAEEAGVPADWSTLARALSDPGVGPVHLAMRRKDGVERVHLVSLSRLENERGRVTGYVSTSEDVTEVLESQRRLEESLSAEREAVARLQQVDEVKDAFVSSVSHELRTPITSMVGFLELLVDGSYGTLSSAQRYALERVYANTTRLLALIDDLLLLSRMHAQTTPQPGAQLDLRDAVETAYAVVAPTWATPRELDVRLVLPDEPVATVGHRDALERVVVNLLGNAVKFTPDGGSIEVALRCEDEETAQIEVSDTGIGIPAEEAHLVFSRFFRSSLALRNAVPGTGLGLSITRAVIEDHGGGISVNAREGGGTTFVVELPLQRPKD